MHNGVIDSRQIMRNTVQKNGISPITTTASPASVCSTNSDSPTPTNSIHEKNWASRYQSIGACEEQRQLLGTEEESSDRHSSDGETDSNEVWYITEEQHKYYEAQFKCLQPDISSLINGQEARRFFEKSRLPVEELRKIWQLADITKDGALSLPEFKVAMHLVVLRRNKIPLPDTLPKPLVVTLPPPRSPIMSNPGSSRTSPPSKGREWTKFADSPTSALSSPKPVNFDFPQGAVESNPDIVHPVALRVTPAPDTFIEEVRNELRRASVVDQQIVLDIAPKPIQRPQPRKPTAPGPGAIPPPPPTTVENNGSAGPCSLPVNSGKKDPPPPPPPRPNRTHFRSSSLDLTRLGRNITNAPSIPPRISPNMNSPFKQLSDEQGNLYFADFNKVATHGAFYIYKRPVSGCQDQINAVDAERKLLAQRSGTEDVNLYLRNLCTELQGELNGLREERIALQTKLDRLHSRSPVLTHSLS